MNVLDWIMLISILVAILVGLWRGFLGQVLAIAGIFIVALLTMLLTPVVRLAFSFIDNEALQSVVAIVVTAVILATIYIVVTFILRRVINHLPVLGKINRILGAVFSLIVVYMIFAILTAIVLRTNENFLKNCKSLFRGSSFVKFIYGGDAHPKRNFFGNWLIDLLQRKIDSLKPQQEQAAKVLLMLSQKI